MFDHNESSRGENELISLPLSYHIDMVGIMPINLGGYLLPVKLSSHPRGAPAEDPSLAATGRGTTKNVCDVPRAEVALHL